MTELIIIKPDDFHNHLRQGDLMPHLVRETAKVFQRTLVMPNTLPPVTNSKELKKYYSELKDVETDLEFLMTFKIMQESTPELIVDLKRSGAIAGKLYPQGVTTHSEDGVTDIEQLFEVFAAMQEQGLVLCIHGETPEVDELKAESTFLPVLQKLNQNFPKLRIVLEHVSSQAALELVKSLPDTVAATITVHHLYLTINDVRTDHGFISENFCKPIAKTEADRKSLVETVLSENPKFFLGTDSAPHPQADKVGDSPKPGVYSTPVALPLLAQVFDEANKLESLESFTSKFGANFYQLEFNSKQLTLFKEEWTVPEDYFGVIPLHTRNSIQWKISEL